MALTGKMKFGKWKDTAFDDVDASYLVWVYENDVALWDGDMWEYLNENIDAIYDEAGGDMGNFMDFGPDWEG